MKKETKQNILYSPLNLLLHMAAYLPMWILYGVSDILFVIVYFVMRYRHKVVKDNINRSFPDMSEKERKRIIRRFYRNFTDYAVETIKLLHISDTAMRKRMIYENIEILEETVKRGRSAVVLLGHYGNWEWITSVTLWSKEFDNIVFAQIYRPLRNEWFDRLFLRLRSRFHSLGIAKKSTLRELIKLKRSGKPSVTGFMSDQKPSGSDLNHWITWLNRDTPIITGYEELAQKLDFEVFYFDVQKLSRGHYKTTVRLITHDATKCGKYEIVDSYAKLMEQTILRDPSAWLWSHKRWKQKRPENVNISQK